MKQIVQVYKAAEQWTHVNPPGIGDYLRGLCHLYELGQERGFEVRADISGTGYWSCVDHASPIFVESGVQRIAEAAELFDRDDELFSAIDQFMTDSADTLHLVTNLGHWSRPNLPERTQRFARQFYAFRDGISDRSAMGLQSKHYGVLSVRMGDSYFGTDRSPSKRELRYIEAQIKRKVLPVADLPIVLMSDSEVVKEQLAKRFGFIPTLSAAAHGSRVGAEAVCRDLDLLAHSATNFHLNAWNYWWSGFSHYTSLIFDIPSINYAPVVPRTLHEHLHHASRRLRGKI